MKKLIILLICCFSITGVCEEITPKQKDAAEKAGEAFYIQSGVRKYVDKIKNRHLSKTTQEVVSWTSLSIKSILENKYEIKFTWNW